MKETVVHVKNLKKIYHTRVNKGLFSTEKKVVEAVKDISFDIYREEVVGFIGPNGAGKTTTLKCLSGLLVPTGGEVEGG